MRLYSALMFRFATGHSLRRMQRRAVAPAGAQRAARDRSVAVLEYVALEAFSEV